MRAQPFVAWALLVGGCSFDLTAIASDAPRDADVDATFVVPGATAIGP